MKTKICTKCKQEKARSEFYKNGKYWHSYCKPCWNQYQKVKGKKYYKKRDRWIKIQHEYNITKQQWEAMFNMQQGCCWICGKHQSELSTTLCVDHNHKTGQVRGLLCGNCNTKLGWYERYQSQIHTYL